MCVDDRFPESEGLEMWWMDENGALPESSERGGSAIRYRQGLQENTVPKGKKRLRLPITEAQATANLLLQESGASGEGESKVLRNDIRALESRVKEQREELNQAEIQFASLKDSAEESAVLSLEAVGGLEQKLDYASAGLHSRECWARDAVAECSRLIQLILDERSQFAERELEFDAWQQEVEADERDRVKDLEEIRRNEEGLKARIVELEFSLRQQLEQHQLDLQKSVASAVSGSTQEKDRTITELHAANRQLLSQSAELVSLKRKLKAATETSSDKDAESFEQMERLHEDRTAELQSKLDEVARELDCAMSELHDSRRMIEQIRGEHSRCAAKLFEQIEQAEEQSIHSATECSRQRHRAETLQKEIANLNARDESQNGTIGELRDEIAKLTVKLEESHADRGSSSQCATELRRQLDDLMLRHRNLSEDHLRSQSAHAELTKNNGALICENEQLTQSVEQLSVANEQLTRSKSEAATQARQEIRELNVQLNDRQKELEAAERFADEKVAKIRSERDELQSELQSLRVAADESRQDHDRQVAKLSSTLEMQTDELEKAMSDSEMLQAKLESAVASFERKRLEHDAALHQRDSELTVAQQEIENLSASVQAEVRQRRVAEVESKRLSVARSQRIGFLARQREALLRELAELRDDRSESSEGRRAA